ncbi:MAG: hypothetical protein E7317_08975 [Clostridiales bacterium]|nr:hypothetical protein [Clostridiales bacterium]
MTLYSAEPALRYALLFFAYAFLGWCAEVAFAALTTKSFINRGFLNGPVCPIYGFGAVGVLLSIYSLNARMPQTRNIAVLCLLSLVITTLIELVAGFALEKMFHTRWWDYSDARWNIGGYVCPQFSLLWSAACVFVVKVIEPALDIALARIPLWAVFAMDMLFTLLTAVDIVVTAASIRSLNDHLRQLNNVAHDMHAISDGLGEKIYESTMAVSDRAERGGEMLNAGMERLSQAKQATEQRIDRSRQNVIRHIADGREGVSQRLDGARRQLEERRARFAALLQEHHFGESRLMRAFPTMRHMSYPEALDALRGAYGSLRRRRKDSTDQGE